MTFRFTVFLIATVCYMQQAMADKPNTILIRLRSMAQSDSLSISYADPFGKREIPTRKSLLEPGKYRPSQWEVISVKPVTVVIRKGKTNIQFLVEPGNDITIHEDSQKIYVTGNGSETFQALYEDILPQFDRLKEPSSPRLEVPQSLQDFLEWNDYLNKKSDIIHHEIDKYAAKYPSPIWEYTKFQQLSQVESNRAGKFMLLDYAKKNLRLSHREIVGIYSTHINNSNQKWLFSFDREMPAMESFCRIIEPVLAIKYDRNDPANVELHRKNILKYEQYFKITDSLFSDKFKDQLLTYLLLSRIARTGAVDIANDFTGIVFPMLTHHEYKSYIIDELAAYASRYSNYGLITNFLLKDMNGKEITRKDLAHKILVFHVNDPLHPENDVLFERACAEFAGNPDVVLAEIEYGPSFQEWRNKLQKQKNGQSSINTWYAPHTGDYRDYIQNIHAVSRKYQNTAIFYALNAAEHRNMINKSAFNNIIKQPGKDTVTAALEFIRSELAKTDGPYIIANGDTNYVLNIRESRPQKEIYLNKLPEALTVYINSGSDSFTVRIRDEFPPSSSIYHQPEKIIALSDLEGNFSAFHHFLVTHKVMDKSFNWTFGKGHLVITGDVFDRGIQVTECLWLIYMLEEKARQAGGMVHYILGNHEVMNMVGDFRYIHPRYERFANQLQLNYSELYGPHSLLGKWLRSKNVVEAIGNNLFTHGGVSRQLNTLQLPLEQINHLNRSYLSNSPVTGKDSLALAIITDSKTSPYWNREYYKGVKSEQMPIIDQTLNLYKVNRIITGHSLVDDITAYFDGKVINTDTRHVSGDTEGLMIEGNKLYRLLPGGQHAELLVK